MKYLIYSGDRMIGWSLLEGGDPPMGVASGIFHPSEHYAEMQPLYRIHFEQNGHLPPEVWEKISALDLKAVSESGELIEPFVGIHITDASGELADEPLEVEVFGIDSEIYARLFPAQCRAYYGEEAV